MRWIVFFSMASLAATAACEPPRSPSDGDADGDTDTDVDSDADADEDADVCPPEAECCEDSECTNGVFCDGVEVCDRGRCEPGMPIDCDDGRACTVDECDEARNRCVHAPDHAECDDGDICTGDERCDPTNEDAAEDGCVMGAPMRCDDGDPCTDDFCDDGACQVAIRDSDDDGFGDMDCYICDPEDPEDCTAGEDCNDANPLTYPGAEEICDDGEDNDCDRFRDYADDSCAVPNDACADAIAMTDGVVVHSSTRGTTADIDTACGGPTDRDVAFSFNIATAQDVEVSIANRSAAVTASLTAACGDPEAEVRCLSGRTFSLFSRALPAGSYYLVITSPSEVDFDVTLHLSDPVAAADGDLCGTATDVSTGGSFTGSTVGMLPDYDSACGEPTDLDVAYAFTLTEARALDLTITPGAEELTVAMQPDCGVVGTERSCFTADAPTTRHYRWLDPGTYHLVFKTAAEDTFGFDLAFGVAEETSLIPYVPPTGHTAVTASGSDDSQYNIDITPLRFPFNGETFDRVAVSTNGYIRFGDGSYPSATSYSDSSTDIEEVFPGGTAQISWLAADGYSGSAVSYLVDVVEQRVVITYLDYHRLGSYDPQDIQIVLFCDSGDIQLSYVDCNFDTSTDHWSIGVSEPALGGTFQGHDFPAHVPGTAASFGPGAVGQDPEHTGAAPYLPLAGRAIFFSRSGSGWEILVDDIPL